MTAEDNVTEVRVPFVETDALTPKQFAAYQDAKTAQDAYLEWAKEGEALLKARKKALAALEKTGVSRYRMAKIFKVSQTTIGNILGTAGTPRAKRYGSRR